jgi:hypothetical protein
VSSPGRARGDVRPKTYEIAVDDLKVEGETALPIWRGTTQQAEMPFAVDTFVIEDGKIAIQTFAAKIEPEQDAAAAAPRSLVAPAEDPHEGSPHGNHTDDQLVDGVEHGQASSVLAWHALACRAGLTD